MTVKITVLMASSCSQPIPIEYGMCNGIATLSLQPGVEEIEPVSDRKVSEFFDRNKSS
jgi:hypothetical protein